MATPNSIFSQTTDIENNTNNTYESLLSYVGTFPCTKNSEFSKNYFVIQEVKKILNDDYRYYLNYINICSCAKIVEVDGIVVVDYAQMHVGANNCTILFDVANQKTYLFWLKGSKKANSPGYVDMAVIYGERPLPSYIHKLIEEKWGPFELIENSVSVNFL
jgi:hypothetical protein